MRLNAVKELLPLRHPSDDILRELVKVLAHVCEAADLTPGPLLYPASWAGKVLLRDANAAGEEERILFAIQLVLRHQYARVKKE